MTEAQFEDAIYTGRDTWVLADGRAVIGTAYQTLTGNASVPDLRGVFIRGKNNGRSDGNENPVGDMSLGAAQGPTNKSHTHTVSATQPVDGGYILEGGDTYDKSRTTAAASFSSVGASESRPRNITLNAFIRIT